VRCEDEDGMLKLLGSVDLEEGKENLKTAREPTKIGNILRDDI